MTPEAHCVAQLELEQRLLEYFIFTQLSFQQNTSQAIAHSLMKTAGSRFV